MKTRIVWGMLLLSALSCTTSPDKEIHQVVDAFFRKYKGDFRELDSSLITKDLSSLVRKAVEKERSEADKVLHSSTPTDKPLLIEGDILTSLYEGQDSFKIDHIKIEGEKALVTVQFFNTHYKEAWKDEVLLIRDKHWRIDNVIYEDQADPQSTKDRLQDFLAAGE